MNYWCEMKVQVEEDVCANRIKICGISCKHEEEKGKLSNGGGGEEEQSGTNDNDEKNA
jgi:hypothetical protein